MQSVAITINPVVDMKGSNPIPFSADFLPFLPDFVKLDSKGQLRHNDPQRIYHFFQALGPNHQQRLGPFRIGHSQEQTRQATDMISMKVRNTNRINLLIAPALLL